MITTRYVVLVWHQTTAPACWVWGYAPRYNHLAKDTPYGPAQVGTFFNGEKIARFTANREEAVRIARQTGGRLERWEYTDGKCRRRSEPKKYGFELNRIRD